MADVFGLPFDLFLFLIMIYILIILFVFFQKDLEKKYGRKKKKR